jgi:hypothetical protein
LLVAALFAAPAFAQRPVKGDIVSLTVPDYRQECRDAGRTGSVTVTAVIMADAFSRLRGRQIRDPLRVIARLLR